MDGTSREGRLLIGDLVLDVGQRCVTRGGVPLDLPKLSFRLLHALAVAAPNVLTQDQLIERVWPGRVISPETLTQRVKLLRQVLGDDAREPRYIGLVRGQGYRLLSAVGPVPEIDERPGVLLLGELVRRNVLPIAGVYAAAAWAISRGLVELMDALPVLPLWSPTLAAIVLTAGFPATLWLAWRRGGSGFLGRAWSSSVEGRLSAATALLLLVGATVGLASLIYPTAGPAANAIAVLPFEKRGGEPDDDYLSEGLSDQLRDQLGDLAGLRVSARASSVIFRGEPIAPTAIAERLGVSKLVTGTFQQLDDLLHVNVEIVDGVTGSQLWRAQYVDLRERLLAVQQLIIDDVATQLLPQSPRESLASGLPTESESAYSLMMIANNYYLAVLDQPVVNRSLLHAAIEAYRRAVAEDANSPLLHSRLAAALLYAGQVDEAGASIGRALELDENRSHVQHTLGLYLHARREDGVGEHFARAVDLNPNNVEALGDYGLYLYPNADVAGAESHLARALELDPMSLGRYETLGNFYGTIGFNEKARALAREITERFDSAEANLVLARIYELTGDLDEAIAWAMLARERDPALETAGWKLGELYTRINDSESAEFYDPEPQVSKLYFSGSYEEMIDLASDQYFDDDSPLMLFTLARAYTATDRDETAVLVLSHYGLPVRVERDSVTSSEIEAAVNLADALKQTGREEEARRLARPLVDLFISLRDQHPDSWNAYFNLACLLSIVGDDEGALSTLEQMVEKPGLPWYPAVKDQPCFRKAFAGEPRYESVLQTIRDRTERLREKLPDTLARFGLSSEVPLP